MKFRDQQVQQTSELELAPMIDVVFLLLIFFLVSWQYARFERTEGIETPISEEGESLGRKPGEIIVNVSSEGEFLISGQPIDEEALLARLKSLSAAYPDQAVILRGDQRADYASVHRLFKIFSDGGIWNVSISTKKKPEEGAVVQ